MIRAAAGREGHSKNSEQSVPGQKWVGNVREAAATFPLSLGVSDWRAVALNFGRRGDLVEAPVGFKLCSASRIKIEVKYLISENSAK